MSVPIIIPFPATTSDNVPAPAWVVVLVWIVIAAAGLATLALLTILVRDVWRDHHHERKE